MTITAALILFAVTWFVVFLCILPMRQVSQVAAGQIVPGSASSAAFWRASRSGATRTGSARAASKPGLRPARRPRGSNPS